MHARPALFEAAERKAARGAQLKQPAGVPAGFEPDFPIPPAIFPGTDLPRLGDPLERRRRLARGERQLDGQGGAGFIQRTLELLAAMREEQQAIAQPLGMLHDVR